MSRQLPNFIEAYIKYAEIYNAPPAYVKWAALWVLGTAVTRQVGMRAHGNVLHPNLYTSMVGGPSAGKSQAVRGIRDVLLKAGTFKVIPASTTRAATEDYIKDNTNQRLAQDGTPTISSECIGLSDEMHGILPDQDLGHLTLYNQLYDSPEIHSARTRMHGEIRLERPYCAIFTGAQPGFLATTMPEQAWGMGFMSRTIMVWDVMKERRSAFATPEPNFALLAKLIADAKSLTKLSGWFTWTQQAKGLYEEWWIKNAGAPVPRAKRLTMGYNGRRDMHFMKLAMCMSLSESSELVITEAHAMAALKLLLETESRMGHIFAEMSNSGSTIALAELIDLVKANAAANRATPEAEIVHHLLQRFPATQVMALVENLITSGGLAVQQGGSALPTKGFRQFMPGKAAGM